MEQKQPLGLLFGSVGYYSPKDIDSICDEMNLEQAYFMIIKALEYSHNSSLFSLQESEVVSKSLRIMNSHFTETDK